LDLGNFQLIEQSIAETRRRRPHLLPTDRPSLTKMKVVRDLDSHRR
jgi:hypothetical protein